VIIAASLGTVLGFVLCRCVNREKDLETIRIEERTAVAREIHDTLLQGAQALALRLDCLASEVKDASLGSRISALSSLARESIVEGRVRIAILRHCPRNFQNSLSDLFRIAEANARERGMRFLFRCRGSAKDLAPGLASELPAMIRELLANAFQHSSAREVKLAISFGPLFFAVAVHDDGIGLNRKDLLNAELDAHWGIRGIKERAARVGGRLLFAPAYPQGTKATLRVFAFRAYDCRRRKQISSSLIGRYLPPESSRTGKTYIQNVCEVEAIGKRRIIGQHRREIASNIAQNAKRDSLMMDVIISALFAASVVIGAYALFECMMKK